MVKTSPREGLGLHHHVNMPQNIVKQHPLRRPNGCARPPACLPKIEQERKAVAP